MDASNYKHTRRAVCVLWALAAAVVAYLCTQIKPLVDPALGYIAVFAPLALYIGYSLYEAWDAARARWGPWGVAALIFLLGGWHSLFTALVPGATWGADAVFWADLLLGAGFLAVWQGREQRWVWALAGLLALWLPYEFYLFQELDLPGPGGADVVRLLSLDAGLLLFVAAWDLKGVGFDLGLRWTDFKEAGKNFGIVALPLIGLGLVMHFNRWNPRPLDFNALVLTPLGIYFMNALPEEFLFRGVLHNLLSRKIKNENACLALSSFIFGLTHIKHAPTPNWRYVIMATLAGWFYGRTYLRTGKCTASALVHTAVNWSWFLAFRL